MNAKKQKNIERTFYMTAPYNEHSLLQLISFELTFCLEHLGSLCLLSLLNVKLSQKKRQTTNLKTIIICISTKKT